MALNILRNRKTAVLVMAIILLIVFLQNFLSPVVPSLTDAQKTLQTWAILLAGFMIAFGATAAILYQYQRIVKPGRQRYWGVWVLSITVITTIFGFADLNLTNPVYTFLRDAMYSPLSTTFYAVLGLLVITAVFRAAKTRNVEAAFFMVSVYILMLYYAPFGGTVLPPIVNLGSWVVAVPQTAGTRAIFIVGAVGLIILGLRTLLGYERGSLG